MLNKRQILAEDRAHLWHPYTQMKDYAARDPLVIVKGRGVQLIDADGRRYYDTIASWWCNVHGHSHPALARAVARQARQLDHVLFAGVVHPPVAELTRLLRQRLDRSLSRFFFSDNGSTSVEIALKMSFQSWRNQGINGKHRFVFLKNSYHGDTVGSMSVGGIELYHRLYAPLRFKSYQATAPQCRVCPQRRSPVTGDAVDVNCRLQCFRPMERLLRTEKKNIAAVIVEPLMQGSAGISFYPPRYLQHLRTLTRELEIILIFDEVATGFGRLGTFFAYEQAGVVPDIICLSKGLTGGTLPLAITAVHEAIYQSFYSDDAAQHTFFHGHTYTANPIACAAAVANLKLMYARRLPESQQPVIDYFHERLAEWGALDWVRDVRGRGFVGAVDIVRSRRTKEPFQPETRIGFQIYLESLKHGLLLRPLGDTIYWFLPLAVSKKDVRIIMDRSRLAVETAVTAALARRPA